ncbi:hypothetical protein ES703_92435 [subsurface metagenome]
MMENIVLEASSHTPMVVFNHSGRLKMEGRSFPENVSKFYDPLISFVTEISSNCVVLDINLEYFNTASSKKLMDLFKHLDANNNVQNILIKWHYEEGDDDSVETAEIFEESLFRTEFRYLEIEDATL